MGILLLNRRRTPFIGALDGYSNIAAAYSVRRLSSSYTGNLVGLRRASDNGESNFGYDASGDLDVAAIAAWAGGASYIHTWYTQSGSANVVQSTANKQALYATGLTNGRPGFRFDGVDDISESSQAINQPQHVFAVICQKGWTNDDYIWDGDTVIRMGLQQTNVSPQFRMQTGVAGLSVSANIDSYYVITAYYNSADTSYIRVNGSQTNNAGAIGNNATGVTLGARGDESRWGYVEFLEFIVFSTQQTTADQTALEQNIAAYYGITLV